MQPTSDGGLDLASVTDHQAGEQTRRDRLGTSLGLTVAVVAGTVLVIGWGLGVDVVTRVLPGLESMKVNTTIGLLALGLASCAAPRWPRAVAPVAAVALAVGVLTWIEHGFAISLGIDELVFEDPTGGPAPGRPGLNTAICFTLLGLAWLLAQPSATPRVHAAGRMMGLVSGLLAGFALIGYLFGVAGIRGLGSATEMALHTSVSLVIATMAFAVITSERGPLAVLWSPNVGGQMGRALLLPGIGTVLLCGLVAEGLAAAGVLDSEGVELVFVITLVIVVQGIQVAVAANRLERVGIAEAAARSEATAVRNRLAQLNDDLEHRVEDRTSELAVAIEELKRSNRDLEQFTFAASHDLKEPLRMVSMYTGLLVERYGDVLDDRGLTYAGYAVEGANRMRELIDGVLRFTSAGEGDLRQVPVDLGQIVRDVAIELAPAADLVEVEQPLPVVIGDPRVLREVLTIVIDNGMKFVADGVEPHLHVTGLSHESGDAIIRVADNGIGITQPDRVGEMFMRLNHRSQYPGTGVGLAVAQRLLRRHGGGVTATARPGGGTVMEIRIGDVVSTTSGL